MTRHSIATLLAVAVVIATTTSCRTGASSTAPATMSGSTTPASAVSRSGDRRQEWLDMFARGYFPGRSGQVFYVPHEGDFLVDKDPLYQFMHGSPWSYDTSIPMLFYGPGYVRTGAFSEPTVQQDIVPTLARLLRTAPPATTTGRVLTAALDPSVTTRPRVIMLFVLDGTRRDYFDTQADALPTLSRLRREGSWFSAARTTSMPTATSLGHATIGTGTDPRIHGLVVNRLFNRVTGAAQESYNNLDPGELMALTLADVWNLATDGKAVIVGQGGAIRATAGLIGHGACLVNGRKVIAASYLARDAGGWETNPECYTMSPALTGMTAERYWKEAGGKWMGHDISSAASFRSSGAFMKFEGDALAAVLENAALGTDDVTDLVMVNVKSIDYVSHAYGPASKEVHEALSELDRQIARAMQIVEKKAGPRNTVFAFTADHGMPGEPPKGGRRIMPAEVVEALNQRFSPAPPSIVQFFNDSANAQIHLDNARIAQLGFTLKDIAAFLESRFFEAAFTEDEVREALIRMK